MRMNEVEIRAFAPSDRDWLVAAHGQNYSRDEGFDDSFSILVAQIIDAFIADHDPLAECGWIAWKGDVRLGCIFCVRLDAQTAKLRLFLLEPAARGLGLGRRLLGTCTDFAKSAGYKRMSLWTHESHEAACALYAKTGWVRQTSHPVRSFGVELIEQSWTLEF